MSETHEEYVVQRESVSVRGRYVDWLGLIQKAEALKELRGCLRRYPERQWRIIHRVTTETVVDA